MGRLVLAVDIGGTKLAAGLVDSTAGRVVRRAAIPTPRSDDAEVVFAALLGLVEELGPDGAGADVCGIGSGGPMTAGGEELTPVPIPAWQAFPLRRRMEDAAGLPVFVDNDAKAVALAEGWTGAAAGMSAYIGMVVSTGIGGGIVVDFSRGAHIRPAGLGGDAPLVGAAAVALYRLGRLP